MPPRHTVLAVSALAFALAFGPGARAQDDDDGDDDAATAPIVVDIDGSCRLTVAGQDVPCRSVAYMIFPANHRIDFTAITEDTGWAFSGGEDAKRDGLYTLDLDSVLRPGAGRLEAEGVCEMRVSEDRRTVESLDCRAMTEDGELTLTASGTVMLEGTADDDGEDGADGDDS